MWFFCHFFQSGKNIRRSVTCTGYDVLYLYGLLKRDCLLPHFHLSELQHRIATADDQLAYTELFNRMAPYLLKFVGSMVQPKEAAEEIVLDVFMRIWEKRKTLDHVNNFKLYLYVSARNHAVNYLRSKNHQYVLRIDALEPDLYATTNAVEEASEHADTMRQLQMAVNELPIRCRIIFKLVKEDGLKQREVAELMHLNPKTVENQLAIALKKLAHILAPKQQAP
ncbi:MAG: RNA polymerase sigma-70 factor [Bacteroidetes bacterium]|nr:MAG: RNA polymerase sigma-70 factor [Bacteroidota bacterium]